MYPERRALSLRPNWIIVSVHDNDEGRWKYRKGYRPHLSDDLTVNNGIGSAPANPQNHPPTISLIDVSRAESTLFTTELDYRVEHDNDGGVSLS